MSPVVTVSFARALQAEWIKLRSLRSTWYTVVCLFVVGLGITGLTMGSQGDEYLTTYIVAQLIIGVLGILIVTSEYATGLIQPSLSATPRRHRMLAAKVVLATALAMVAGQALMFASFSLGQAILAAQDVPNASLGDPGVFSAVTGGGVYLSAIALLAVGLGTIMRATAGALATLVGIVFLVPAIGSILPSWLQGILYFWPTQGAAAVLTTVPDSAFPHPWLNLGGMCLGVAAVLAAAFAVFRRRDV
jgi:ABC-2 type transport system permease protein